MVKKSILNAGSPIYASTFVDDVTFAVGGGGGQGAHGIKNKVVVYKLKPNAVETGALDLPDGSDSVTSIACGSDRKLAVGVNIPKTEKHINRLLQLDVSSDGTIDSKLNDDSVLHLYNSDDITIYQRSISALGSVVLIANSVDPGTVYRISPTHRMLSIKYDAEILDIAQNEESQFAALSASKIEIRSSARPQTTLAVVNAAEKHHWSRIVPVGKGEFAASSTYANRSGAFITIFAVSPEGKVEVKKKFKVGDFKGVTALAGSGIIVAAANANGDVYTYNSFSGEAMTKLKGLHKLPVTSLSLSPDRQTLVSTSMDGSVIVSTDLYGGISVKSVLFTLLVLFVSIAVFYVGNKDRFTLSTPADDPTISASSEPSYPPGVVGGALHKVHGMGHGPVVKTFTSDGTVVEYPTNIKLVEENSDEEKYTPSADPVAEPDEAFADQPTETSDLKEQTVAEEEPTPDIPYKPASEAAPGPEEDLTDVQEPETASASTQYTDETKPTPIEAPDAEPGSDTRGEIHDEV